MKHRQNNVIACRLIAFNPNMFDVFTALQSELSAGTVQPITSDDKKKDENAE